MIKSINQLITERCNSKCKMCSIWSLKNKSYEMTSKEFNNLYSMHDFREVEDLCISGGEPTLRKDIFRVVDNIIENLPKLRMLFLSTNGSNPKIVKNFVKRYSSKVKEIYICISLEGNREVNKIIRGVDSYEKVVETVRLVNSLKLRNSKIIFSTTIVPENCNEKSLNHIRRLAKELGCTFSFRLASRNDTFYHNTRSKNFLINKNQLEFLKEYIQLNNISDPFLDILFDFLNGKKTITGSRKTGISCLAGDISVFIKPNGDIYPCINSSRLIGNKDRGIFIHNYKLGNKELCPCCTECQIYPLINFSKYSDKR
jgi:MoaA/NifB/PqqE/SkfB family radical SAM enzyme